MGRRFQKVHRTFVQRSLRRRKRQQELAREASPKKHEASRLDRMWDSEEGLFVGDSFVAAAELELLCIA